MKARIILIIASVIFMLLMTLVLADPNAPVQFGNLTATTVWIGGNQGIVNATGQVYAFGVPVFLSSNGTLVYGNISLLSSQISSMPNLSLSQIGGNIGNYSANALGFYNSSTIPAYYLSSNPLAFYNSSTLPSFVTTANGTFIYANLSLRAAQIASMPNLSLANIKTNMGNYSANALAFYNSSTLPSFVTTSNGTLIYGNLSLHTMQIASLPNLSFANINANMGNYSANALGYYNSSTLPSFVTTANGTFIYANLSLQAAQIASMPNITLAQAITAVTNANGNFSASSSTLAGTGTAICAAGTVAQNITTTTSGITTQCVVASSSTGLGNVTGAGVSSYLSKWTNVSDIGSSSIWDNGTQVNITTDLSLGSGSVSGYITGSGTQLIANSSLFNISNAATVNNSPVCTVANGLCAGLTLAQINTNMGNYSANTLGYYNASTLPSFVTTANGTLIYGNLSLQTAQIASLSNLTLAQINTNMGNYSANTLGYYNSSTLPAGLTLAQVNTNMGNYSSNALGYYNSTTIPSFVTTTNGTLIYGNLSQKLSAETDPLWTGNSSLVYFKSNPFGFYNSSTLPAQLTLALINTNMGNWSADKSSYATTASLSSYYLATNPLGYYNSSTLPSSLTLAQINTNMGNWSADKSSYATTVLLTTETNLRTGNDSLLYLKTNPSGFFNTTGQIEALGFNHTADIQTLFDGRYFPITGIAGAVGQNLTHALIVSSEGNWSADKSSYSTTASSKTLFIQNNGTLTSTDWCLWNTNKLDCTVTPITNNNQLSNGANYISSYTETDPRWQGNSSLVAYAAQLPAAVGQNLTYALINTNMGNWSADKSSYATLGALSGAVGQNLTYALIVASEGNWSADKSSYATTASLSSYYLATNPLGFYNSTTLPATAYQSSAAGWANDSLETRTVGRNVSIQGSTAQLKFADNTDAKNYTIGIGSSGAFLNFVSPNSATLLQFDNNANGVNTQNLVSTSSYNGASAFTAKGASGMTVPIFQVQKSDTTPLLVVNDTGAYANTFTVTGNAQLTGNVTMDAGTFFEDSTNNKVGINTSAPGQSLTVVGTANVTGATYLGNSKCPAGQYLTSDPSTGLLSCGTPASGGASSAAGWTNTSTTTSTALNVNVNGTVTVQQKVLGDVIDRVMMANGSTLMYDLWDGGNFHHYYYGSIYNNMNGNSFTISGNGNTNSQLSITGGARIAIDPNIDGSSNGILAGGYSYATAGTPLTTDNVVNINTFAWNGSVGWQNSSSAIIGMQQKTGNNSDAELYIKNGFTGSHLLSINMLNGNVGIGTTTPGQSLTVNGTANITGTTYAKNVTIDGASLTYNGSCLMINIGGGQGALC